MSLVRVLVSCVNDPQFAKVRGWIEQAGYASNPERILLNVLTLSRALNESTAIGLYLFSLLDDEDIDLICLLASNIKHNQYGHPSWNFRDAAKKRLAERVMEGWKENRRGQELRIERRRILLQERWKVLAPTLKEAYNRALSTLQQDLDSSGESGSWDNLCAL